MAASARNMTGTIHRLLPFTLLVVGSRLSAADRSAGVRVPDEVRPVCERLPAHKRASYKQGAEIAGSNPKTRTQGLKPAPQKDSE
jgi:hypothetical protein